MEIPRIAAQDIRTALQNLYRDPAPAKEAGTTHCVVFTSAELHFPPRAVIIRAAHAAGARFTPDQGPEADAAIHACLTERGFPVVECTRRDGRCCGGESGIDPVDSSYLPPAAL